MESQGSRFGPQETPHTPQTASLLLGLAQDYFEACLACHEFAASEAAKAMLEALQSRHMHGHLKLVLMDERATRRAQDASGAALVAIPFSLWKSVVQPLLEMMDTEETPALAPLPSFAERVWPRVTVN